MTYSEQIEELIRRVLSIKEEKGYAALGIDGRSNSGKSTLSKYLAERLDATLIHMDDFFLRPEQRTPERYATPGENVDYERFIKEVLEPLTRKEEFSYRPFTPVTMSFKEPVFVPANSIVIIEGSYSMRPDLRHFYDLSIFLDVRPEVQIERVKIREPGKVEDYINKWIPFEEKYHEAYDVRNVVDIVIDTSDAF